MTKQLFFLATLALLFSCSSSSDKTYEPTIASAIINSVYLCVQNEKGEVIDQDQLLKDAKVQVRGCESRKQLHITSTAIGDVKFLSFSPDLPHREVMRFWDTNEGKRGTGYSEAELTIDGVTMKLRFHYDYAEALNAEKLLGGSSIILKSVECNGKKVSVQDHTQLFIITMKKTAGGYELRP